MFNRIKRGDRYNKQAKIGLIGQVFVLSN